MIRYIIGEKVDKDFSLKIKAPIVPIGTSELCRENDLYEIELTAPYKNDEKTKIFVVHLYASNSNSNPYLFQRDNYWVNLIPTWKFYDEQGKNIITNIPITVTYRKDENEHEYLVGSAKFHYVDDMPSSPSVPIYIWATLDTEKIVLDENNSYEEDEYETDQELTDENYSVIFAGTTKKTEKISNNGKCYMPPSYANSKVIAVTTTIINSVPPTKLSITRNSIDSISNGIYWSNQIIPFVATVNSDRSTYAPFREEDEKIDVTSDVIYNYPNSPNVISELSGAIYIKYDDIKSKDFASLVEKYIYFVENKWDFVSKYLPPQEVLETSGYIPPKNILEIMDYPTYDDLQHLYPDINLKDYFENLCNRCSDPEKPNENILYLDNYVRLINEHRIFKYIPYALRIIDTISVGKDGETKYVFSNISALSATGDFDYPTFKLLDDTHGYNYKTGGYAFGKALCPDLSGDDYVGRIDASAYVDDSQPTSFAYHIFKYWAISDGKFIYAADDRNTISENDDEINEYITDQVIHPAVENKKIDDLIKTENDDHFYVKGGYIGASCVVEDPLYNAWICDADTGYLYKYSITNELKYSINLNQKLDDFITTHITDETFLSYWNNVKGGDYPNFTPPKQFVSPTHMVLNSKNELYITFFDTMILAKLNGLNGEIINVYLFPNNTETNPEGLPLDGSWRPVGIDTNEFDEVVVLFNTAYNEGNPDPLYSVPSDAKLVFFDGEDFYDEVITISSYGDIFNEYVDRHVTTNQVLFRSNPLTDHIYVAGSIDYFGIKEYAFVLRYQRKRQSTVADCPCCDTNENKIDVIFKYERLCSLPERPTTAQDDPNAFDYKPPETSPTDFHLEIDCMYMDTHGSLWFVLNRDYSQTTKEEEIIKKKIIVPYEIGDRIKIINTGSQELDNLYWIYDGPSPTNPDIAIIHSEDDSSITRTVNFANIESVLIIDEQRKLPPHVKSDLIAIKDARERIPHAAAFIPIYNTEWITGISQTTTSDMLLLDAEHNKIVKFTPINGGDYLKYHQGLDIDIENESTDYEIGRLFARGDWTGMDWLNKYTKATRKTIITTDIGNTTLNLCAYEKRYVRKHHEEWDVAEHAKIPVAHTFFADDNPELFTTIGETLGINEHKHYSIGKKLFEGIANQVANIHDVDECHINSIYSLSNKEDVNIDKFILNYPEELRRMTDLLSVTRKKLWGDRCHCTQNYFRTKHRDETRYCPKCRHIHTTNVGSLINPLDTSIWALVTYVIRYENEIDELIWDDLVPVIYDQLVVLNSVLDLNPRINDNIIIETTIDSIEPINSMLECIEGYVHYKLDKLTKQSEYHDVLNAVNYIHQFIKTLPNAYLIENKFARDNFIRVNISKKSYLEAEDIYNKIKSNTYLTDSDIILMSQGKTNARIILYASVLNIEEEALDICCDPRTVAPDPDNYKDPNTMYEAKSILENQIESFNDAFDFGYDEHGNPIKIDPNVPTVSYEFDQKIDEVIEALDYTINKQIQQLVSQRHSWTDVVSILREFNKIIYNAYLDEFNKTDHSTCINRPRVNPTPQLLERIKCAQLLAIHTSFFSPDHWYNYCFWRLRPYQCHTLNTSVINWESPYTTMDEYNKNIKKDWYENNGTMIKLMNYILHNGTLFHKNEEYIDD